MNVQRGCKFNLVVIKLCLYALEWRKHHTNTAFHLRIQPFNVVFLQSLCIVVRSASLTYIKDSGKYTIAKSRDVREILSVACRGTHSFRLVLDYNRM